MERPIAAKFTILTLIVGLLVLPAPALAVPACGPATDEIAELRRQLEAKDRAIRQLTDRLGVLAVGNIRTVEQALAGTGIAVERLIRRGRIANQGGPFIPEGSARRDIERWDSLQRVMKVLPLASPLASYVVSSAFGPRKDPLNRRRAMHQGIDLTAPRGSKVMATGPGRVVVAGPMGRYGKLVEIDHGMGVRTRYAHLDSILVKKGQAVVSGQRIGTLGSSGRTTGPHLHYEIIVDGKPNNPKRFIRAGKRLQDVAASTYR